MERLRTFSMVAALALPYLVTAGTLAQDKTQSKSLGNCSDVVFHEKTNRLFVAAGTAGTHVLAAKDGKLSLITTLSDEGCPRKLAISGDRLYVADLQRGLAVLDITGRDPVCIWRQQNAQGMGVCLQDHHAYLAAGAEGLQVYDISAKDAPKLAGKCKVGTRARDIWVCGKYACVADEQQGLAIVDVSTPSRLQRIAQVAWGKDKSTAEVVRGEGSLAYLAAGRDGLVIVDLKAPRSPVVVSRYQSHPSGFAKGLWVQDGLVYLASANGDSREDNGLIVIDVRDPKLPKTMGKCALAGNVEGLCRAGRHVFLANALAGVRSIDVSDPNRPRLVDSFGPAGEDKQVAFLETEISPPERAAIEYLQKTKGEVLQGRKVADLSTPANAFLTVLSAYYQRDPNGLKQVLPIVKLKPQLSAPAVGAKMLDFFGKCAIARVEVEDKSPQESDLAAIYTSEAPGNKINQVVMFGYIQGAWRFLGGASDIIKNWRPYAGQVEAVTREILQKEAQKNR